MIRVVFLDIDNTLLSFSDYVRETMLIGDSLTSDIAGGKIMVCRRAGIGGKHSPSPLAASQTLSLTI